jgi:hypothetical protein
VLTLEQKRSALLTLYRHANSELTEREWSIACVYLSILTQRFVRNALNELTVFRSVQPSDDPSAPTHMLLETMDRKTIDLQEGRFYGGFRAGDVLVEGTAELAGGIRKPWEFIERGYVKSPRNRPAERAEAILRRTYEELAHAPATPRAILENLAKTPDGIIVPTEHGRQSEVPAQLLTERAGRRLLGVSKSGTAWYSTE